MLGAIALTEIEIGAALGAKTLTLLGAKKSSGKREHGFVLDRLTYFYTILINEQIFIPLVLGFQLSGYGTVKLDLHHLGNRLKTTSAHAFHGKLTGCGQRNISTCILDLTANVNVFGEGITHTLICDRKIVFKFLRGYLSVKYSLYVYLHDITFTI